MALNIDWGIQVVSKETKIMFIQVYIHHTRNEEAILGIGSFESDQHLEECYIMAVEWGRKVNLIITPC